MGRPKALLSVPPDGTPLLAHVIARLKPIVEKPVFVVTADLALASMIDVGPGVTWLQDAWPDAGALGGMATGLQHTLGWALVVACDLPLVRAEVCRWLSSLIAEDGTGEDSCDVILPVVASREQPLHALYHRRCLPAIAAHLALGDRRMSSFLPDVRVRRVDEAELRPIDPELRSFFNVNTPEEWARAVEWLTG